MSAAVRQIRFAGLARMVALTSLFALPVCSISQGKQSVAKAGKDEEEIKHLISMYAKAADEADATLASRIWCDSSEDSLINPEGRWHGVGQITGFYRHDMGENYSLRKLTITDISVQVYSEAAWAEFKWEFSATRRKEGLSVSFHGMETQIYQKNRDGWCLVHVHYSALPPEKEAQNRVNQSEFMSGCDPLQLCNRLPGNGNRSVPMSAYELAHREAPEGAAPFRPFN